MDLKAGGEISDSKIGTTPHALTRPSGQNQNTPERELCDLPLNTKLETESTSGELAECIRDDPERNERSDEKDKDTGKKESSSVDLKFVRAGGYVHDREATTDVLTQPTSHSASPISGWIIRNSSKSGEKKTCAIAPQFPMIVATVALGAVNPLLCSR